MRFLVPLLVLVLGIWAVEPAALSGFLVLWTTLVTLHRAQQVANALRQPGLLVNFYQLPVSNSAVFRHQERIVLRGSLGLGADWLAFAVVLAVHQGGPAAWLAVPIIVLAQWASSLAIAMALVRWNPYLPYGSLAGVLWFVLWLGLQLANKVSVVATVVRPIRVGLERYSPAGLLARAGAEAANGGFLAWLALAGAALTAWWLIRLGTAALHEGFSLERLFGYDDVDPAPVWTRAEPAVDGVDASAPPFSAEPLPPAMDPAPVDLPALRAALRTELDQPAGLGLFRRGFIERLIVRRLSYRQRVLVDFLQPQGFGWSRSWLIALGCVVVAHLLLVAGMQGGFPGALAGGGVLLLALPVFGGLWAGSSSADVHQARIGVQSLLPLGFWELAGTRLLVAALRCVIALPLLCLLMAFGFTAVPLPWTEALAWTLHAFVAILAVQPVWVFLWFSGTTNDVSSRWWFTVAVVLGLMLGFVPVAIAMGTIAASAGFGYQLIGDVLLLAHTYGALFLYGLAYNRGVFDLIGKPTAQT